MTRRNLKKIPAVQQFSVDEIPESSHGPLVALNLTVFSSKGGAKPESIDIGLRLDQAEAIGNALVLLSEKMKSRLQ